MRGLPFSFLLLMAAAPVAAQPVVQSADEALAQDAAEYARSHSVALDEAIHRLHAQEESVAATDALQARDAKRLAGISIEHEPDYRIVVLLTGSKPVADETAQGVPVIFRTGAPATRTRILKAIDKHAKDIRAAVPRRPGL